MLRRRGFAIGPAPLFLRSSATVSATFKPHLAPCRGTYRQPGAGLRPAIERRCSLLREEKNHSMKKKS